MLDTNYFVLFNLSVDFRCDITQLTKNYLMLQKQHHPDIAKKHEISEHLNYAYQILKDDIKRAEYILEINKVNIEDFRNDLEYLETLEECMEMHQLDLEVLENKKRKVINDISFDNIRDFALSTIKLKHIQRAICEKSALE